MAQFLVASVLPWLVTASWLAVAIAYRSAIIRVMRDTMTEPQHLYKLVIFFVGLDIAYNVGIGSILTGFAPKSDLAVPGRLFGQVFHIALAIAAIWIRRAMR